MHSLSSPSEIILLVNFNWFAIAFYLDKVLILDEINDGEEDYITEHPEVAGRIVEEKAVRLLNYSLLIIQNADSMETSEVNNKENEAKDNETKDNEIKRK